MPHLTAEAHRVFATQHGVAAVDQLLRAGLTQRQIQLLHRAGALEHVVRGTYRTPSAPFSELARCAAISLARPDVAVAGPTAGRLWGLRRLPADHRVHVIGPRASNPAIAPWVVTYRTDAIHERDVLVRSDGIRVTSRARTVLDLARWLSPDDLLSVIEQVAHDGRITDDELREVAADWLSPQRRWLQTYLFQVDRRLRGGAAESHPEVVVAEALQRAGVRGLVRQFEVDLPEYGRARFDLAVPRLKWAVEIDVHPTHQEFAGRRRDRHRDRAATAVGWRVTRIRRDAYEHHLGRSIASAVHEYRGLSGEPAPPPAGDERTDAITSVGSSPSNDPSRR